MINLNHKVKPDSEVVLTEVEEKEAVLLHLGTKMYFTLNETGLRIWQMANDDLTFKEIIEKLQEEFDVTPQQAEKSVVNLFNELLSEKLVKIVNE